MRLIDADTLPKFTGTALSAADVARAVENAPTIDPVKHGEWVSKNGWVSCSVCGSEPVNEINTETPYCPFCGAMMDEPKQISAEFAKLMTEGEIQEISAEFAKLMTEGKIQVRWKK